MRPPIRVCLLALVLPVAAFGLPALDGLCPVAGLVAAAVVLAGSLLTLIGWR